MQVNHASEWTRDLGVHLHDAMFGNEHRRCWAKKDVWNHWLAKPRLLRVVEHALLSKETLKEVQKSLDQGGTAYRQRSLDRTLKFTTVPAVPLFPM
jgi:hypothetical protein